MGDGASDTGESVTESSNDSGIEGGEIEGGGIEGSDGTIDHGDHGNHSDHSDHSDCSNHDYKAVHNFIVPAHALCSIGHDSGLQNKQVVSDSEKEDSSDSTSEGDESNEEVIHTHNLHASLHKNDILQRNKVVSNGGIDGDANTISQVSAGQEAHALGEPDLFGASHVTGGVFQGRAVGNVYNFGDGGYNFNNDGYDCKCMLFILLAAVLTSYLQIIRC